MVTGPNPPPPAGTTADMILRHDADGLYEIYDIGNNAFLAANFLGQVRTDFQVAGLGSFFGSDTTDMLLRSASTGAFEVYDISNNNITNAAALGTVGLEIQVAGFGDFNRDGSTDMVLRNKNTGQFELYNISNNTITSASNLGTVGLTFQVAGFRDFNADGTTEHDAAQHDQRPIRALRHRQQSDHVGLQHRRGWLPSRGVCRTSPRTARPT